MANHSECLLTIEPNMFSDSPFAEHRYHTAMRRDPNMQCGFSQCHVCDALSPARWRTK